MMHIEFNNNLNYSEMLPRLIFSLNSLKYFWSNLTYIYISSTN